MDILSASVTQRNARSSDALEHEASAQDARAERFHRIKLEWPSFKKVLAAKNEKYNLYILINDPESTE